MDSVSIGNRTSFLQSVCCMMKECMLTAFTECCSLLTVLQIAVWNKTAYSYKWNSEILKETIQISN